MVNDRVLIVENVVVIDLHRLRIFAAKNPEKSQFDRVFRVKLLHIAGILFYL